jgi:putative transposase
MQVSRSAFYNWLHNSKHPALKSQHQTQMEALIIHTFQEHHRRYGVRRLVAELRRQGVKASKYTVQKVLHQHALAAIQPHSFVPRTTQSRHPYPISPNLLLERAFPTAPNEVWVGDLTYLPLTGGGFLYLAVWMDLYSRRIVGWHLEEHMREALVQQALKKALQSRRIQDALIVHSDRGGQYAGKSFRSLLEVYGLRQSMSRAENVYDNAFMEALFSRFKAELLQGGAFQNKQDAYTEIFEYIEMYYNTKRRHSALNYESPMHYENSYYNSLT